MLEKRARQEVLNNSFLKKRRKNMSKTDTSMSNVSQDISMETEETDSEIKLNFGGSPTSYKSPNHAVESSAEKRYAETLAKTLKGSDSTPLTSVGTSSSNKLRLRKSLEMEMDIEEDMFSSDNGEAISKVKRRSKNVIVSSDQSENESSRAMKKASNTLLRKAMVNRTVATTKEQNVDILEMLNTPVADRRKVVKEVNKLDKPSFVLPEKAQEKVPSDRRMSRSPFIVLENLKIKPLQEVTKDVESTDSDCLTEDFSPVAKRVTRQAKQQKVMSKETVTAPARRTRGQSRNSKSKKLQAIIEEPQESGGDSNAESGFSQRSSQDEEKGKEEQRTMTMTKRSTQRRGRKRHVESVTESEPEAKKKSTAKGKTTRGKTNTKRNKRNPQKDNEVKEPTIADMLQENKSKRNDKSALPSDRREFTDQSDDENNGPPWTETEMQSLRRYAKCASKCTPFVVYRITSKIVTHTFILNCTMSN